MKDFTLKGTCKTNMDPGCMRMAFPKLYICQGTASLILCQVAQQQHTEQPEQPHSQLLHPRPTLTIGRQLVTSNVQRMNPPRPRRARREGLT